MPKKGTGWRKQNMRIGGDVYRPRRHPTSKNDLPGDIIASTSIGNRQYDVCCDGSLRRVRA